MKAIMCMLALLPGSVLAMSAQDYLDHCRTKSVYDQAQCMGYLDALLERDASAEVRAAPGAHGMLEVTLPLRVDDYCLPDGAQLPLLRDVVVRMLEGMPTARLRGDAGVLIKGVLRHTYPPPCAP
ncbi:Rap1a/Tai family immunity protein [Solimonas terrae]|uniref:Rap1a immunity protein domain-containing protein n=1 Tax=Solimonas terrae TaxID=1396819 RepID=A0A6M2BW43_9GAMM|nr:Rap1a/Tai family immunity protein [Solimonas terrae]NGY06485.1 hypothetical protein [Solimonas terrae]